MRTAARIDLNQPEIVAALRKIGATVQHLHTIGAGCPDILVGYRGQNILMEIKMPGKAYQLTPDEFLWHAAWQGSVWVVRSPAEAVAAVVGRLREAVEQE